jgi:hypothetical protein
MGRIDLAEFSDNDRCRQLIVNIVSAVFNRHGAAASAAGNNGDGFAAVAAQREQKAIEFLVFRLNPLDQIFFSDFRIS